MLEKLLEEVEETYDNICEWIEKNPLKSLFIVLILIAFVFGGGYISDNREPTCENGELESTTESTYREYEQYGDRLESTVTTLEELYSEIREQNKSSN